MRNPGFQGTCLICGSELHGHETKQCQLKVRAGCDYCYNWAHHVSVCPVLHGACRRCDLRGHDRSNCTNKHDKDIDAFERFADQGMLTKMRFQHPELGVYHHGFILDGNLKGLYTYSELLMMKPPRAKQMLHSIRVYLHENRVRTAQTRELRSVLVNAQKPMMEKLLEAEQKRDQEQGSKETVPSTPTVERTPVKVTSHSRQRGRGKRPTSTLKETRSQGTETDLEEPKPGTSGHGIQKTRIIWSRSYSKTSSETETSDSRRSGSRRRGHP